MRRRHRRHPRRDLFRPILIADVEHAHAGVVIGREDRLLADEAAGPVLVQVVRAEVAHRAEVAPRRRRQRRDRHGVLLGARVDDPGVERALRAEVGVRLVGDDDELALRQRQRRVRAAGIRRRPVDVRQQLRVRGVADVVNREPAVAPRRVAAVARDDHVMQRVALALRRRRRFAAGPVHAGQPPARHDLRLRDVGEIDDAENVIREAVEMRGHVRVAAAGPPQPVDADAGHLEKRDLARLCRVRVDVEDRQARAERLAVRQLVGERVLEVVAHVVVRLHAHDVGAVREQHEPFGDLQVMRARVRRRREELAAASARAGRARRAP